MNITSRRISGISKLSLLILLLAAGSLGAALSYMWTVAYYVEVGHRVPQGITTITVTNVTFPLEDCTYFEVSVLNPSYSNADANIAGIAVVGMDDGAEAVLDVPPESVEPPIPYPLSKGEDVTFRCLINWQDFAGQMVYVSVFLQDGSGATSPYETARVKLQVTNVEFNTRVTVRRFNVTVVNSLESSISLNVSEILFDSTSIPHENITIKDEGGSLPTQLSPGGRTIFICNWNLLEEGALNSSHTITVRTLQGYSATYQTPTLPPPPSLSITNVVFAVPHTDTFEMTILNQASSPHYVSISKVIVVNGTQRFDNVSILPTPPLMLEPGDNVTLKCSWNWDPFRGQEVGITVYTKQGFYTQTDALVEAAGNPVASFDYSPTSPHSGQAVNFDARGSYDTYGTIVNYTWDFGDGNNATGEIAIHTYTDDGDYLVSLNVTDDDGLTDATSVNITVLNNPPVASFTESDTIVLTNHTITFNGSESYDPDGSVILWFWDFGDGDNDTGVIASHAYLDNGNYTVTLAVTDDDGSTSVANATKTVLNRPPIASFTESTENATIGETINFNASGSYDSDGSIVNYFWDFGDGSNDTGITASHAYATNGTFIVTLTVTDDDGATASVNATKTVLPTGLYSMYLIDPAEVVHDSIAAAQWTGVIYGFEGSETPDASLCIARNTTNAKR